MMVRTVTMLAFAVLLAPEEPNLGMGAPSTITQIPAVSTFQQEALRRLAEVRAELEANHAYCLAKGATAAAFSRPGGEAQMRQARAAAGPPQV